MLQQVGVWVQRVGVTNYQLKGKVKWANQETMRARVSSFESVTW
jgi:hypothetical protein